MDSTVALDTTASDITLLGLDHPGASDPVYRARRDEMAALAHAYRTAGLGMPPIRHHDGEHATWAAVCARLAPLHERHASSVWQRGRHLLGLSSQRLPDLAALGRRLQTVSGFNLQPIEGLVDSRYFLGRLAEGILCCTTYIRHGSRPEYTPEPDVVHEVIGHVPPLADPAFARLSRLIGGAAAEASDRTLLRLERLYWHTLEFGLLEERSGVRAYGAGLLSSSGELQHAFDGRAEHRPFVLEEVVELPYDFTHMQPVLFVAPSLDFLEREVRRFLAMEGIS